MARRNTPQGLRAGGYAWSGWRVECGLSIRELAEASGVNRGLLSLAEAGRYLPTAEEWAAVIGALREREAINGA